MMVRTLRLFVLLASSSALLTVLAACGGSDGGSKVELQSRNAASTVGPCPDFVLCIKGDHWDTNQCRCVPDGDDAGAAADAADETAVDAAATPPDAGASPGDDGGDAGDEGDASSCPNH